MDDAVAARVEVVLTDLLQGVDDPSPGDPATTTQLREGYEMVSVGGTKKDEVWATTGAVLDNLNPTVYSIVPRLKIEKLDDEHTPIFETFDQAIWEGFGTDGPGGYSAEVNASGKVIYGYNSDLEGRRPACGHTERRLVAAEFRIG